MDNVARFLVAFHELDRTGVFDSDLAREWENASQEWLMMARAEDALPARVSSFIV